ncbi:hypothetical protein BOO24_16375 [Vibrio navarrensis]|uniref:LysR family transcriptional regulator n=1 Tax=Vibrio navarrensis TaxID=29495 RepID=UPI001869AB11|nr:LysR family transcriptional regulator [Vibrio navarrensis]MBE4593910.1 hypothetical protein [Vibrio navarrensis]
MTGYLEMLGKTKSYYTLDQLRAFVVVAHTGSYTEAARVLRKDRTTLREHIENLEIDFNLTLLSKEGKRITLTEHGEVILRGARSLLLGADTLNNLANSLSEKEVKHINVMLDKHFPDEIVTIIEQDISETFPNLTIHWAHSTNQGSIATLSKGDADIAVIQHLSSHSGFHPPAGLSVCFLGNLKGTIFARNSSPLQELDLVSMADLTYEDRLIYDGDIEDTKVITGGLPTNFQVFSSKGLLLSCLKVKGWTYLPYVAVTSDLLAHISPLKCDFINDSWFTSHVLLHRPATKSSATTYIAEKIKRHYKQYAEKSVAESFNKKAS